MNISISNKLIDEMPIPEECKFLSHGSQYTNLKSGQGHYKLLAYLSNKFDGVKIVEFGTLWGLSSFHLAANKNNTVYSYDFKNDRNFSHEINNIHYIMDDCMKHLDEILDAKILFIDIDHNSDKEIEIIDYIEYNKYKGIVILDDIYLPKMEKLLNFIKNKKEFLDVTKYGHYSGTGILNYSDVKFILE